jgi:hypothetical protein
VRTRPMGHDHGGDDATRTRAELTGRTVDQPRHPRGMFADHAGSLRSLLWWGRPARSSGEAAVGVERMAAPAQSPPSLAVGTAQRRGRHLPCAAALAPRRCRLSRGALPKRGTGAVLRPARHSARTGPHGSGTKRSSTNYEARRNSLSPAQPLVTPVSRGAGRAAMPIGGPLTGTPVPCRRRNVPRDHH